MCRAMLFLTAAAAVSPGASPGGFAAASDEMLPHMAATGVLAWPWCVGAAAE